MSKIFRKLGGEV